MTKDIGKRYSVTTLKYIRQFYKFSKSHSLSDRLTYTYYKMLLSLKDKNEIDYYIKISIENNFSVRELSFKIKSNEYKRLDENTKLKLIHQDDSKIEDFVKNPIIIKNKNNYDIISEKILQKLILEDINHFLEELSNNFCYIKNEYKIKIDNTYNYIDDNLKNGTQNNTIGIIICRKDNRYIIEYCSDDRIIAKVYELV